MGLLGTKSGQLGTFVPWLRHWKKDTLPRPASLTCTPLSITAARHDTRAHTQVISISCVSLGVASAARRTVSPFAVKEIICGGGFEASSGPVGVADAMFEQ